MSTAEATPHTRKPGQTREAESIPTGHRSSLGTVFDRYVTFSLIALTAAVLSLRIWIIRYGTEAADDHVEVAGRYLTLGRLPRAGDCYECYHPKLYYVLLAKLFEQFEIEDRLVRIQLGAYFNWCMGVVIAAAVWFFVRKQRLSPVIRASALALAAASAGVTVVATQPSNDALVAATSCVAIASFWYWIERKAVRWLVCATISAGMAAASKGSGLAVFVAVVIGLAMQLVSGRRTMRRQALLGFLLVGLSGTGAWFLGYRDNWIDTGTPLAMNHPPDPKPPWTTPANDPYLDGGCVSILDTYLDFPVRSLLHTAYVVGGKEAPEYRQSFWAMMHGGHFSLRFLHWPTSWQTTAPLTTDVSRASLALGLFPALLVAVGMVSRVWSHVRRARAFGLRVLTADREAWMTVVALTALAMLVKLTMDHRWFSTMKVYYGYAGLLAFTAVFVAGARQLAPSLTRILAVVVTLLTLLQILDVTLLAADLSRSFEHRAPWYASPSPTFVPKQTALSSLLPQAHIVEGTARADADHAGNAVFCDRKMQVSAIGTSPSSNIEFSIGGQFTTFHFGVCNASGDTHDGDGIRFRVLGDGQPLYTSDFIGFRQVERASLDVRGVNRLKLVVHALENDHNDLPVWLDPVLVR